MENLQSLGDLEKLQQPMHEQLGIRLAVAYGVNEVRSMRGIRIEIGTLPRLCRKTRQTLPTAIRRGLENTRRLSPPYLTPMTCFGIFEGLKEGGFGWVKRMIVTGRKRQGADAHCQPALSLPSFEASARVTSAAARLASRDNRRHESETRS